VKFKHKLAAYIMRRLLMLVPLFFGSLTVIFIVVRLSPGDPVLNMYGTGPGIVMPGEIERLRQVLGLDRPLYEQYLLWLWRLMTGDLGYSYQSNVRVIELLGPALLNTIKIQIPSFIMANLIAVYVGVKAAVKQYSKTDYAALISTTVFWSTPWFLQALLAIFVFSVWLGWFPVYGVGGPSIVDQIYHMILPMGLLTIGGTAFTVRLLRSSMLEVLRQDYITTARSKGLGERVVIYRHALKNAMLPVVTTIGLFLGYQLSGATFVETVFNYPGLGLLMVRGAFFRDYPVVMACAVVATLSMIVATFITDVVYALVDPRIRY
jgi:peptide/nickel transport system permease protein